MQLRQSIPIETVRAETNIQLREIFYKKVYHLSYLGSHLSSSIEIQGEIQHCLNVPDQILVAIEIDFSKVVTSEQTQNPGVIPYLLYAFETMTTYQRHLKSLGTSSLKHLDPQLKRHKKKYQRTGTSYNDRI